MINNVAIVIPTIRNLSFLENWRDELKDTFLIVCEDRDSITVKIPDGFEGEVFSHAEMQADLKEKYFIIPHKNASVRSFGYFRAYRLGIPYVITLDDDCFPHDKNFVDEHIQKLNTPCDDRWMMTSSVYTRGFPYLVRKVKETVINHGLWKGVPDLDAPTQLLNPSLRDVDYYTTQIPVGVYFPMCGMNLAFKRKIIPALYFLLMGIDFSYDRFDDIWAGIFVKKICDNNDLAIRSGSPCVFHSKASNVFTNLKKEASGISVNELLWKFVDAFEFSTTGILDNYKELALALSNFDVDTAYFQKLSIAMLAWAELFDD